MADDPMIDTLVAGRYRVLSKLGEGGMGAVYRVEHSTLKKHYALKILRLQTSDNEAVARFDREARAAAHLDHKNIAKCTDVGTLEDGGRFLVMEFIDGESLASLLAREKALPPSRALPILAQISSALACAHGKQIVHRDLKPDNVVLTREGNVVKLIDFGIARAKSQALGGGATALTKAGTMLGTPAYMSPEQVVGQSVNERADQYSFGVIAFEMLTGAPPYAADEPLSLVFKHVGEAIPRASERNPSLDPSVDAIFDRLLAKMPEERFGSVTEGYLALESTLAARPSSAAVAGGALASPGATMADAGRATQPIPQRASSAGAAWGATTVPLAVGVGAVTAIPSSTSITGVAPQPIEQRRSSRGALVWIALGALLLTGGVAFFARGSSGENPAEPTSAPSTQSAPTEPSPAGANAASPGIADSVRSLFGGSQPPATNAPQEPEEREDEEEEERHGRGHGRGHGHGHKRR
ncbi:MAG: serine/threonine-protein kinase [Polyangiales bacterium]